MDTSMEKRFNFLKEDFSNKLGKDYKIYIPKLMYKKYKNNKIVNSINDTPSESAHSAGPKFLFLRKWFGG